MARTLIGTVVSDKGDKTIVISVRVRRTHPIYRKQYTVNTKFMAHDGKNEAHVGDLVSVSETSPVSAKKRFKLDKIIERGGVRFEEADATADVPEEEIVKKPAEERPKNEKKSSPESAREPSKSTKEEKS